jgi:hypothetical protein
VTITFTLSAALPAPWSEYLPDHSTQTWPKVLGWPSREGLSTRHVMRSHMHAPFDFVPTGSKTPAHLASF